MDDKNALFPVGVNQSVRLAWEDVVREAGHDGVHARYPVSYILPDDVDLQLLELALNKAFQRHVALRTTFGPAPHIPDRVHQLLRQTFRRTGLVVPGTYTQIVDETLPYVPLRRTVGSMMRCEEMVCLRDLPAALFTNTSVESRHGVTAYIVEAETNTLLVLVLSHLVADLGAADVLKGDAELIYHQMSIDGSVKCLEDAPHPGHWALEQHENIRNGRFDEQCDYWARMWQCVSVFLPRHERLCPRDGRTDTVGTGREVLSLRAEAVRNLRVAAISLNTTRYVVLRTAIYVVLRWLTGLKSIALFANFANRTDPRYARIVNWCSNQHIVLLKEEVDATFATLCRQMREAVGHAIENQAIPLPAVWQRLGRNEEFSSNTHVTIDWVPKPRPNVEAVARWESVDVAGGRTWMDLDIRAREKGEHVYLALTYNPAKYDPGGMRTILRATDEVLARIARESTCPLSSLENALSGM